MTVTRDAVKGTERAQYALVGGTVVDVATRSLVRGSTVVINGATIESVSTAPAPSDAIVLDVAGLFVLPGLIDAHVHLTLDDDPHLPEELLPYSLTRTATRMLMAGITTVRDLGSPGDWLFDLRRAFDRGLAAGPRLVLCGQVISATCPGSRAFPGMYREADDPAAFRKAVREQLGRGADIVKVMATGAVTVEAEEVAPAQLREDELRALIDEAHRLGVPVAAHAEGADGIQLCVDCRADTIEHGELAHTIPAALESLAARNGILVPTISVFDAVADPDGPYDVPEWMRQRARYLGENARLTVAAALVAGVEMAMGADTGPHGTNARELVKLRDAGLPAWETLAAASTVAARACGLEDSVGSLRGGYRADVVVVDGDPLADISVVADLDRIALVIRDGEIVRNISSRAGEGDGHA